MQAVLVLASRDANGDGHEPRDGNRDCDPKYRVFEHPCEIPLFGHTRASICNYRHLYARDASCGQTGPSRPHALAVRWCAVPVLRMVRPNFYWYGPPEFLLVKARSGSDSCFD